MTPINPNAAALETGAQFGKPRRERPRQNSSTDGADAKTLATARLEARARRIRMIRRRVIAGALALFVATWVFITLQLVTGHDPALAKSSTTSAVTPSSSPSASPSSSGVSSTALTGNSSSGTSSSGSGTSSSGSGSSSGNSSSSGSSVTTSQS
jgi:uncharacterized membrane protein YgcG